MIFLSILIFILAMSLPFFKNKITPIYFTRIAALSFIYAGVLTFNALYIQSIGSGIGIYSGLFQVTYYSIFIETFLYLIGAIILVSWPLVKSADLSLPYSRALLHGIKSLAPEGPPSNAALPNKCQSIRGVEGLDERRPTGRGGDVFKAGRGREAGSLLPRGSNWESSEYSSFSLSSGSVSTPIESREYSLIALFSTLGGAFLLSSGDLLSMYLSIELQSFGLYILASIYKNSDSATSAGLKYFLLGGLSSCLILLGAALVYTFTGLTNFDSIYSLVSVTASLFPNWPQANIHILEMEGGRVVPETMSNLMYSASSYNSASLPANISQGFSLGLVLIVVGFLFKIAGAPFHNWAPDVYDESPTNVTIWLTVMPKIAIILFLLELEMGIAFHLAHPLIQSSSNSIAEGIPLGLQGNLINGGYVLKHIFLLSSLLSLIIGTVVGLAQIRIKRLLAYSTISHIGFLLLALAINTEQSTDSLVFYLIQYTITNLNTFLILLSFGYVINSSLESPYTKSEIRFLFDLKGQFVSNPVLSLSLVVCLFSMAGIPPLIGFFGKQSVLSSAIGNGYYFMSFVAIVVSVISASYYLRIIRELHSQKVTDPLQQAREALSTVNTGLDGVPENPLKIEVERVPALWEKDLRLPDGLRKSSTYPEVLSTYGRKDGDVVKEPSAYGLAPNPLSLLAYPQKPGSLPTANLRPTPKSEAAYGRKEKAEERFPQSSLTLTNIHSFIIATLTMSILFFVLKPSILLNSTVLLSLVLFNG